VFTTFLTLFVFAPVFAAVPVAAQNRPPEPVVSLNAKDKPLAEVLAQITRATGSEFDLDPAWQKVTVTAFVENAPLSVALKRVLSGLNHAIIYLPGNRIKILIYETSPPTSTSAGLPPAMSPVPTRPQRVIPPRSPFPSVPQPVFPESGDPMQNAPPDAGGMMPPIPPTQEESSE
jgi:type II secretory pathway component GspD/PulD (secretin)